MRTEWCALGDADGKVKVEIIGGLSGHLPALSLCLSSARKYITPALDTIDQIKASRPLERASLPARLQASWAPLVGGKQAVTMESNGSKKVLEETTISQINMGLFGESDKTEKPFRTRRTPLENGLIVIRKADEAVRLGPLAARPKDVRIDRSFIQTALRLLARRLFLRDVLQTPDRAG